MTPDRHGAPPDTFRGVWSLVTGGFAILQAKGRQVVDAAMSARGGADHDKLSLREHLSHQFRSFGWVVVWAALVAGCFFNDADSPPSGAVVSTFAGAADLPGSADGPAGEARLRRPSGIWIDKAGTMYVCDSENATIRKVDAAGVVSTVAGSPGNFGSADGPGAQATFWFPHSVVTDSAGNIFVADLKHTIRKIDPTGVVSTYAGAAGIIGFVDGPGAQARFHQPEGVATDSAGNVYVADSGNNAIRKITPDGMVSTLAASPSLDEGIGGADIATVIASPIGITVDSAGSVIVANAGGGTVLKVGPTGEVSLLAGAFALHGSVDGRAADARFNDPFAVASDTAGNVYVSDLFNQTIRKISLDGMVSTVAGAAGSPGESDGTGEEARFNNPWGIAIDAAGDIFVADMDNHTIRKITLTGAAMGVSVRR